MNKKDGDIDDLFLKYNRAIDANEDTQPVIDEAKRTLYAREFKEFVGVVETLNQVTAHARQQKHFRLITRLKQVRDEMKPQDGEGKI